MIGAGTKDSSRPNSPKGTLFAPVVLTSFALACLSFFGCAPSHQGRIVVGSKNFTEQLVLGELIAQQIEAKTALKVERRFYLAGTLICHQAILGGRIDIYPEYTGTALTAVLKESPQGNAQQVFDSVKAEYHRRFDLEVGPPLGFNDTFAIEIRGQDARKFGIRTISEAAQHTPGWRPGFGYEFMERPDGYKGLVTAYGLRFAAAPRIMDLGLLNRALRDGQVDVIAGNTTDGLIPVFDFHILEDDRGYFPPYEAVPIVRSATLAQHPEVRAALAGLLNAVSDADMQRLNYAVDGQHRDPRAVVADFLAGRGGATR